MCCSPARRVATRGPVTDSVTDGHSAPTPSDTWQVTGNQGDVSIKEKYKLSREIINKILSIRSRYEEIKK